MSISGVYALTTQNTSGVLSTGFVDVKLQTYELNSENEEVEFSENKKLLPGETISFIPKVINLGANCYIRIKINYNSLDFSEYVTGFSSNFEKYPLYSLTIEEGVVPKSERYERSHLVKKDDIFKIVSKNDFVYNPMNVRFGALARYKGQEDVSVSGYYDIFSVKESVSKEYMENFLLSEPMINYYNRVSTGSLKEKQRVHFSQFLDFVLPIPPLPEQQKIAEILSTQDKLIELQEKKIEQLKELKKAYLQKMFPKKGSKYPELRFKGFTAPWEQRKLGEISESFEYGLNAAATEYDGKHKYIRITDIDDSTHLFIQDNLTSPDIDFSTADDYLLQEGDVLFARTGASVGKTYIYRSSDGDLYFAGFLIRAKIKSDYDADFVFQNTLTDNYDSYIRITSQRSGQPGVNAQEYANFALSVPCLAEQKKIGAYFSNLDNLITLHQRKSEQEKQKKKALMQLLLTGKVRCI